MNDLRSYIAEASKKKREYSIQAGPDNIIPVIIKDKLHSEEVDIEDFINTVEEKLPFHLLQNIEMIYIGEFPALQDRNAAYADAAIYITNRELTTHDMLENVIHEIAHSVEEFSGPYIYGNDRLQHEFIGKRERLKSILDGQGYTFPEKYYLNTEYSKSFDRFLSDVVGYPTLLSLTMGLFISPYGATSLKEYFANGFEKYYLGDGKLVKQVSPVLYNVLDTIHKESDNI